MRISNEQDVKKSNYLRKKVNVEWLEHECDRFGVNPLTCTAVHRLAASDQRCPRLRWDQPPGALRAKSECALWRLSDRWTPSGKEGTKACRNSYCQWVHSVRKTQQISCMDVQNLECTSSEKLSERRWSFMEWTCNPLRNAKSIWISSLMNKKALTMGGSGQFVLFAQDY